MPELDAISLYNKLARRAQRNGLPEQALLHLSDALRLSRECRRPMLEAHSRNAMGLVYALAGRPDLAAGCWHSALGLMGRVVPNAGSRRLIKTISANLAAFEQR